MEIWKHLKTNSLYMVVGEAICSTNGERDGKEKSVLYFSITCQKWFYREASEFYDGRFVKIEVPEWKGKNKQPPVEKCDCGECEECSCQNCKGFGTQPGWGMAGNKCPECKGTGKPPEPVIMVAQLCDICDFDYAYCTCPVDCPECEGVGNLMTFGGKVNCHKCDGTGRYEK